MKLTREYANENDNNQYPYHNLLGCLYGGIYRVYAYMARSGYIPMVRSRYQVRGLC